MLYLWQPWVKALAEETGKLDGRAVKLDQILNEARAVTEATKGIESKLSGDLWYRQMLMTEKKQLYLQIFDTLDRLRREMTAT